MIFENLRQIEAKIARLFDEFTVKIARAYAQLGYTTKKEFIQDAIRSRLDKSAEE